MDIECTIDPKMVEVVTPNEKVRNLTEGPRRIPIEIEGTDAFEVILTMWTTFDPHEMNVSQSLGEEFHERVRELTSDDLAAEIVNLGGPHCAVWLGIAGLLQTAPRPHNADRVYQWLEEIDPKRLKRWLLGYASHYGIASKIEEAANGDEDAIRELLGDSYDGETLESLQNFFAIPDEDMPRRLAGALKRFYKEVFLSLDIEFGGAIERAAAARRAVASREDARAIVEEVTKGIDYDIPLGVARVVLVPSVVIRPLSILDQHRDALVVYYGIADEFIDADPEGPPSWLVNTYKALSDERRLRILRRLSEGDTSLDELTDLLGLSKSTVHHHMSILRAAGLIRVRVPQEEMTKQRFYGLRGQTLDDANHFLQSYLRTSTPEENQ